MQSVTSNAVAGAVNTINNKFNGLLKWIDKSYGNKTVSSGNYLQLEGRISNKEIISYKILRWSSNDDCFSIFVYSDNSVYLVAKNGTTVTNLEIRFYYLDI